MIIKYYDDTIPSRKAFWALPNSLPFKIEAHLSKVDHDTSLHTYVLDLTVGQHKDTLFSSDEFVYDDLPDDILLDPDKTNDFLLAFFNEVVENTAESLACALERNETVFDLRRTINECKETYPDIWPLNLELEL